MSVLSETLAFARLAESSAALRLLRTDNLAAIASILGTHLGDAGAKLAADDLYERVDADLEVLRDHVALPKNAKAYCDDWRKAGFLIRRPTAHARGETFELSPDAIAALRMLDQLESPRTTVTESRLVSLANSLRQLAIDTDPDVDRRIAALEAERADIDAQIARLRSGDVDVIDERRALERVDDVLQQARDLPGDFARVRARFEQLNRELRTSVLESDDAQRTVLDDIFRGVDHIEASDEGRTFGAFAALIRDPERAAALESDIGDVLDRDFAASLDPASRRMLRTFIRTLSQSSREVHGILTDFARGLRRYVQSQEFQRDRVLKTAIQGALTAAVPAAANTRPFGETRIDLELSAMRLSSIGELAMHDPSEFDTGAALAEEAGSTTDFAALRLIARESEIDFTELVGAVNELLVERGPLTVADVLAERPATQGLASVVGLLSLAARGGSPVEGTERVAWTGLDHVRRTATVGRYVFTERIDG